MWFTKAERPKTQSVHTWPSIKSIYVSPVTYYWKAFLAVANYELWASFSLITHSLTSSEERSDYQQIVTELCAWLRCCSRHQTRSCLSGRGLKDSSILLRESELKAARTCKNCFSLKTKSWDFLQTSHVRGRGCACSGAGSCCASLQMWAWSPQPSEELLIPCPPAGWPGWGGSCRTPR